MTTKPSAERMGGVRPRAVLALEDGTVFEGRSFGRAGEVTGEVVFNTALCGYQEVLTDPSYAGQVVTMTYPHIGNYGVNLEDVESARPQVAGFIVREVSTVVSSWRASGDRGRYLDDHGIVGISEIDTRALTRHLRTHGAKRGVVSALDHDAARKAMGTARLPITTHTVVADLNTLDFWFASGEFLDPPSRGDFVKLPVKSWVSAR